MLVMFYLFIFASHNKKITIMKKSASGNVSFSPREFIELYSFARYLLDEPNVPYKEYRTFGNILLTKQDIAFFKKLVRFFESKY